LIREQAEQLHLAERELDGLRAVEDVQHAERPLLVQERHRHHRVGDVAGALAGLTRPARVVLEVVDDQRLPRDEHPARDPGAGGKAGAQEGLGPFAGDRLEHELVALLVVQEDRGCLRREDRARDLDDRLEQGAVLGLGGHHAGRHRGLEVVVGH
jgi:hypothetical protein